MKTVAVAAAAVLALAASAKERPRLVMVGHTPPLAELAEDIAWYEQQAPFDGIMFHLGLSDVFGGPASSFEKQKAIANLKVWKSINFKYWKYNFLGVLIDQHVPLWFDNDYWKGVAGNWELAARFAKKAGMVGICFDPEGYGVYPVESHWKSQWWIKGAPLKGGGMQPPDKSHAKEEYLAIARKRGRQIGAVVFRQYPEIVLWSYYWWSFNGADLMGAFCNGLLDVMPETARMVDGDEWTSYCAKAPNVYDRMLERNKTGCGLLDKRNGEKQLRQGGFAPAFYMDAYANVDNDCLQPTIRQVKDRAEYFHNNLVAAMRKATGGHIWIYGEKCTWLPPPPKRVREGAEKRRTWEEAIPGIRKALFGKRISK